MTQSVCLNLNWRVHSNVLPCHLRFQSPLATALFRNFSSFGQFLFWISLPGISITHTHTLRLDTLREETFKGHFMASLRQIYLMAHISYLYLRRFYALLAHICCFIVQVRVWSIGGDVICNGLVMVHLCQCGVCGDLFVWYAQQFSVYGKIQIAAVFSLVSQHKNVRACSAQSSKYTHLNAPNIWLTERCCVMLLACFGKILLWK